jgi:hypothetical protein
MLIAVFTLHLMQFPAHKMDVLRGSIVSYDSAMVRVAEQNGTVAECRYDIRSSIERSRQRIEMAAVAVGDRVEIVADRRPSGCYVRTLQVIADFAEGDRVRRPSVRREVPSAKMAVLRGPLVSREANVVRVQVAEGQIAECGFDIRTWMERDGQRLEAAALAVGDRLEIVADQRPTGCYARTLHVLDVPPQNPIAGRRPSMKREYSSPTDRYAPRGDMTVTGLVAELSEQWLTIRTRTEGHQRFLLRHDTRYVGEGLRTAREALARGTRVFVRAGRNFEGVVEAYQVIWGGILKPE